MDVLIPICAALAGAAFSGLVALVIEKVKYRNDRHVQFRRDHFLLFGTFNAAVNRFVAASKVGRYDSESGQEVLDTYESLRLCVTPRVFPSIYAIHGKVGDLMRKEEPLSESEIVSFNALLSDFVDTARMDLEVERLPKFELKSRTTDAREL